MTEIKHVACKTCDGGCILMAKVEDGKIISLQGAPPDYAICDKARYAIEYVNHPNRLTYPLKNMGKRGEQKWERINWEDALDEIAERLKSILDKYGPASFALSTLPVNGGVSSGVPRRFMNLLGSPNWLSGLSMCMGNTAQLHRLTYGWYSISNYEIANCIVYHGKNTHPENWVNEYIKLNKALQRGAKLIVMDPRGSVTTDRAHVHLPLRYGTDAAMLLGWLNIIINEELYDKDFVNAWTVGFEELKKRIQEYPLSRVAKITGCDPVMIREAAVMYATNKPSIIPWAVVPDMQKNSTSVLRCQCILRAICGNLNKGEGIGYLSPDVIPISEIEMHEILSEEQKKKQLGTESYPLFTYEGLKELKEPSQRVYGREYINVFASYMAHPPSVFKAMRTGNPYPIKAFFSVGSNPLMGYANQQGIYEGLMNQELVVVFDHFLTPTAQLADFVLPGIHWLETPLLGPEMDVAPISITSNHIIDPPGECKNEYDLFRGLALRMGLKEYFPWNDLIELYEYRIRNTGMKWPEYEKTPVYPPSRLFNPFTAGTGLATPSGKVELYSSVLNALGYDPLPYYREPEQSPVSNPDLAKEYPLTLFVGLREAPFYNTNLRHITGLKKRLSNPLALLNPEDGNKFGIASGDWIWVETTHGRIKMMAQLDDIQPVSTLRVPHGWWMSEMEPGRETGLSGAMIYNDAMLLSDDPWNLDVEQGIPNLRGGILAKVYRVVKE